MAKRLVDTTKYQRPFIKSLTGPYKLLWDYICLNCNHAGIWIVEIDVAQARIGYDMPVTLEGALEAFKQKIAVFDNGERWFIPSFIEFQYGELNGKNRVHLSVIKELERWGLLGASKGLMNSSEGSMQAPIQGAKDKDKEKDKDKDNRGECREGEAEFPPYEQCPTVTEEFTSSPDEGDEKKVFNAWCEKIKKHPMNLAVKHRTAIVQAIRTNLGPYTADEILSIITESQSKTPYLGVAITEWQNSHKGQPRASPADAERRRKNREAAELAGIKL